MPILHLFCGKIASGKSTLAEKLSAQGDYICFKEDNLLSSLFPNEVTTLEEFSERTARIENMLAPYIIDLLLLDINVILDFHGNTRKRRAWMKTIIDASGCEHILHVLNTRDEVCKNRLRERNALSEHEFKVSGEEYDLFASYYQHPGADERFHISYHED